MNKREFLKVLPLAALTATTIKVDNVEAQVHELKPEKKYLIVIPSEVSMEDGQRFAQGVRARLGQNISFVAGPNVSNLKIYEMDL